MHAFDAFYTHHSAILWLVLLVAILFLALWLLITTLRHRQLKQRFEMLLAATETDNVPAMLANYLTMVREVTGQMRDMQERFDYLMHMFPSVVRHVGLVRFSPFHDTGGDQSFSLAILDGCRNGIVVSALHSRHESRLFAKPIVAGNSRYVLTDEEKQAIAQALGEVQRETTVR
jgi:hypothetical protein